MIKIEVATRVIDTKNGTSAKSGKPYSIREQEAWAFFVGRDGKPNPHPSKIKLTLDDEQKDAYELGVYQLDPASLYADRFGQVSIRARLRPLVAAQPAQPKAA